MAEIIATITPVNLFTDEAHTIICQLSDLKERYLGVEWAVDVATDNDYTAAESDGGWNAGETQVQRHLFF